MTLANLFKAGKHFYLIKRGVRLFQLVMDKYLTMPWDF